MKFRHFVANADLGEMNVSVYGDDDSEIRVLKVHNSRTQEESKGKRISKSDYAALREEWEKDLPNADGNAVTTQRALEWMREQSTNHPNRGKSETTVPTPEVIKSRRLAAGLTQTAAAALIHSTLRAWQEWEAGNRRMHPGLWELFNIRIS